MHAIRNNPFAAVRDFLRLRGVLGHVLAAIFLAIPSYAQTNTNSWNGPGEGLNAWSSTMNWSLGRAPLSNDYVKFGNVGTSSTATNITSVVDSNFNGSVGTFRFVNTGGSHVLFIPAGQHLIVRSLIVGTETPQSLSGILNVIEGAEGSLVVSNSNGELTVSQGGTANATTFDLYGLGLLEVEVDHIVIGITNTTFAVRQGAGNLFLAKTNLMVATGARPFVVGEGGTDVMKPTSASGQLFLGEANKICTDRVVIGSGNILQGDKALVTFNPVFSNATACFRGQDGISRVASFSIGDGPTGVGSAVADFSSGTIDLQADLLCVGRVMTNSMATSTVAARGKLTFSKGTVDVNTIQIGVNPWLGPLDVGGLSSTNHSYAVGTVEIAGTGRLVVNTAVELGNRVSGTVSWTRGELQINGGTVTTPVVNANYLGISNSIIMTNGTLIVTNRMGPGIRWLTMVDSTLQLPATIAASASVTNFITGGTSNTINIGAVVGLNSFPTQVTLVKYSGTISGAGFNLELGTLPPSYTGYLTNNIANSSVDAVLSLLPVLSAQPFGDNLELTAFGNRNSVLEIQISTNLIDWSLLTTVTNSAGSNTILDSMQGSDKRFYRAKQIE
jgi:hypothetical protein